MGRRGVPSLRSPTSAVAFLNVHHDCVPSFRWVIATCDPKHAWIDSPPIPAVRLPLSLAPEADSLSYVSTLPLPVLSLPPTQAPGTENRRSSPQHTSTAWRTPSHTCLRSTYVCVMWAPIHTFTTCVSLCTDLCGKGTRHTKQPRMPSHTLALRDSARARSTHCSRKPSFSRPGRAKPFANTLSFHPAVDPQRRDSFLPL